MSTILMWLDTHNGTITAFATIIRAGLMAWYVRLTGQTLTAVRTQQHIAEQDRFSALRPLVHPERWQNPNNPNDSSADVIVYTRAINGHAAVGRFKWGEPAVGLLIANVGRGSALDLCAVLLPPPNPPPPESQRYTLWRYALLPADGHLYPAGLLGGASRIPWSSQIVSRDDPNVSLTLHAPPRLSPMERGLAATPNVIARLTMTYRDVFGRKHASIFDFTSDRQWINGQFVANIVHDLLDLEAQAWDVVTSTQTVHSVQDATPPTPDGEQL